ncbi:MAG: 1-(5-phosphoribosyl)-5-[(5-phosphoribosylamino)methylideneamino]imidazole-4-carboxamide isomerase [Eubacteriales bacterium]|nr:1-(5-phosphoribosyl)-5-[(5-phosphoribosylamino)methylideneamino]imidazole-4-carboxamide isomerase [Eubacteriales bacterium]MDD3866006.1 1-(5-phosphoribosyl)-5-[(5-phosphoribosylamino)methylideneamino]imidazole-4-carboxamide isomerase [Eubacteriales bacterium]
MIIYPAIDLLDGQCVRLRQGRYDEVTVYHSNPLELARRFQAAGAAWIHIVDLNAARSGQPYHARQIADIRSATGLKIQTGGGIRSMEQIEVLLDQHQIDRVVLGTAAVRDRRLTESALKRYGWRIAIGIDAADGEVRVEGWTQGSGMKTMEFARLMSDLGATTVIFTDISRDGMMTGTAIDEVRRLTEMTSLQVIASGGIGSMQDIEAVRQTGAAGVIVGRAIYEGKVRLEACWQKG